MRTLRTAAPHTTRSSTRPRPASSRFSRVPVRLLSLATLALVLVMGNAVAALGVAHAQPRAAAPTLIGPKTYYLGLGDSLAFGYQPNNDFNHGYVQQWYTGDLSTKGTRSVTDYGCNGETSTTFVKGGCPYWYLVHNFYTGSQLSAAVRFIQGHAGQVSPVTLDIGANDLIPDINSATCSVPDLSAWNSHLATLDANLKNTILPQLAKALTNRKGARTGDLVLMNYYDPYQCSVTLPDGSTSSSAYYVKQINDHLAADAATFNVRVADAYTPFIGNSATYTWLSSTYHDFHATTAGYGAIAGAFRSVTGY